MANQEHVAMLKQGVAAWNAWREENPAIFVDLGGANLGVFDLGQADLRLANLRLANLNKAFLVEADLGQADLRLADLRLANLNEALLDGAFLNGANLNCAFLDGAHLEGAHLNEAHLNGAFLNGAFLTDADLTDADLTDANLEGSVLLRTNFTKATLANCRIYGISAWDLILTDSIQRDLIVTPKDQPAITVDNLEVAQFIYLLLHNEKIRSIIDTITSKAVLILGRFTPERKAVLDGLRSELRKYGFTPILFDFDKPKSRNLTETVSTLAHMARFVIADITDAKSIPQELQHIVPGLPSLPVQPIIAESQYEYSMFIDFQDYPWVLPVHRYTDTDALLSQLAQKVVSPALNKAKEIEDRRKVWEEESKRVEVSSS